MSAFTILCWMDRVRKIVAKNRKPSWELQLRLSRFVFLLLGGPMICSCCLRVFLIWLFTLYIFILELCEFAALVFALATNASYFLLFLSLILEFSFFHNVLWDVKERKIPFYVCLLHFFAVLIEQKVQQKILRFHLLLMIIHVWKGRGREGKNLQ